ncbi:MAG: J domain-containing protein [Burkholderiaceae bacterium]|nr:J domain-containing protein [Burkholderiaceae bacterium]
MEPTLLPEQALAFYRAPTDYPELRNPRRALRGDAVNILKIALDADPSSVGAPSGIAGIDEWVAAARFFVEQVLLSPGADYYRVNGLPRGASAADLRENHRLLIRLLHPDRIKLDPDWQAAAAARANQAYATLRDPLTRAAYDHEIALERLARMRPETPEPGRPRHPSARPPAPIADLGRPGANSLQRRAWRNVPTIVLSLVLGAAIAWVGWLWLERERAAVLAGFDTGAPMIAAAPAPAPVAAVVLPPPAPRPEATPPRVEPAPPVPTPTPVAIATPPIVPVVVPPRPEPAPAAEPAPQPEPGAVLAPLAQRYAGGDLAGFMALFDAVARNETGGRAKIRSDYADLFSTTVRRNLAISGVSWVERGGIWNGQGSFQVTVQRRDENVLRRYTGVIRLEVATDGGRPLIRGIFHNVTGQTVEER